MVSNGEGTLVSLLYTVTNISQAFENIGRVNMEHIVDSLLFPQNPTQKQASRHKVGNTDFLDSLKKYRY